MPQTDCVCVCVRYSPRSMSVYHGSSTECCEELSLAICPLEIILLGSEPHLWLGTGLGLNQCPSMCHPLKVRIDLRNNDLFLGGTDNFKIAYLMEM